MRAYETQRGWLRPMPSSDAREERSVVEDLASDVGTRAFSALVMQDAARGRRDSLRVPIPSSVRAPANSGSATSAMSSG